MNINSKLFSLAIGVFGLLVFLNSCADKTVSNNDASMIDTTGISTSGTMRFEGEIISLPSPIQVATLIQKNNIPFNEDLVSSIQNRSRFLNETKKALNLGVYGTDLAYIANYNLGQINNDYFDALVAISADLGILENIDKKIVAKLNASLSERDSILSLNAEFFRTADTYLKANQRPHISSLILVGGWIESLHLTADASRMSPELLNRFGEQKYSANSVLSLVDKLEDPIFSPIKGEIIKLCEMLNKLENSYTYRQPINDQREKITYIRSQTSVSVSTEQLAEIAEQVAIVRNSIIE